MKAGGGVSDITPAPPAGIDRHFQEADETSNPNTDKLVPERIEGRLPYKDSMVTIVQQMAGGLRASLDRCRCVSCCAPGHRRSVVSRCRRWGSPRRCRE
jgi:IMP dehydrogenase